MRTALLALALVLGMSGVVLAPASPALAACTGTRCDGLSPNGRCSASATPEEEFYGTDQDPSSQYTVQLKYSAGCYSWWGRAKRTSCYYSPPAYTRVQRQITTPYGGTAITHTYYSGQLPCNGAWVVTPMIGENPSDRMRSCIAYAYDDRHPSAWPDSWWDCTGWVY
jgi:hypothetical protein